MGRHYSFGTADLVALMAAHRAIMACSAGQFDQSLVDRLRADLNTRDVPDSGSNHPARRLPAAGKTEWSEALMQQFGLHRLHGFDVP